MADPKKPGDMATPDKSDPNTFQAVTPAEFAKIPLDFIIATPLLTVIEAHKAAASTTLNFIESLKDKTASFRISVDETDKDGTVTKSQDVAVPLLAIVKVPSLNFDSMSISFNFNISQVSRQEDKSSQKAELKVATKGPLAAFVDASLTGSVEHSRTRENVSNRGGSLEIKLHVSETQLPPGLDKIISAIVENIPFPPK
jgi:hypothetical protein